MSQVKKYSNEWYKIHGQEFGHTNPIKAAQGGYPVRLSKSSFIQYDSCPRKYWWNAVAEIREPPTHYMVHGTAVHRALENVYGNWDKEDEKPTELLPLALKDWEADGHHVPHQHWDDDQKNTYEMSVEALMELEEERLRRWGLEGFSPVEFEVKHTIKHPEHNVILVGMIDGVLRHPDGSLIIAELKTGKATKGKLTKTRKELCYYRYMLSLLGYEEAVYFYYLFPECTNTDLYHELEGKKGTEVWLGNLKGMAVLEKVNARSVNAMHKSLNKACEGITNGVWDMKWNDYFCTEWCGFNLSCESQLLGLEGDPTLSYTADGE
ncbi:MAG: PD-(D/E)XK nuclease family protein [Candidatus Poseidoniales archaeon]